MEKESEKIIIEKIKEVLAKMTFSEVEVEVLEGKEAATVFNIKTDESSFLIGQYGVNLQALQHILRVVCKNNLPERTNFILDINSYRLEKNSSIEIMAREAAEEAIQEKKDIILRPMTPYERRIVHVELSKNTQIKTESIGEGEARRIVIKPV